MKTTFEQDGAKYVLLVERRLAHPLEKVWRVVTEAEHLALWFPARVDGEWSVGSALRFTFLHGEGEGLSDEELRGEVLAVDEPRLLEFRWGAHVLRFELAPDGVGCLFRLSETFEDPSWGARNAAGWEMCIENLDLVLEGGAALKFAAGMWRTKFQQYVRRFEPEFGPQQDPSGDHALLKEGDETRRE